MKFLIESSYQKFLQKENFKMPSKLPPISPRKLPTTFPELSIPLKHVLTLIGYGYNTKEIANFLGVTNKTIEFHRTNLFKIFNTNNIAILVRAAIKMKLVRD